MWIPKVLKAIIYVRNYGLARDCASEEKYEDALVYLDKCFAFKHKNPKAYFMRGFLVGALNGMDKAISDFTLGMKIVSENDRFNNDEMEYFRSYAKNLLEIDNCNYDSSLFYFEKFSIENVSEDILEDFPLGEGEQVWQALSKAKRFGGIRSRSRAPK